MLKAVVCVAVLGLAAPVSQAFFTGGASANGLRMVGGDTVSDANTYSYQVAIRPIRTQGGTQVLLPVCAGIILAGTDGNGAATAWILTSATCALSGTSYRIWVGQNRVQQNTPADYFELNANLAIIHPTYLQTFRSSDLALIPDALSVIQSHLDGTNTTRRTVSAALLPTISDSTRSYLATSVSMAGWGYPNDVFASSSPVLRQLTSRVVPNFYCSAVHFGKPITGEHICTGGLINKGPCTGDAGAPLVVRNSGGNRVIGLATLTPTGGCSKGKPGVFTRTGNYLDWITSITNYNID